ncbi:hypothetical protein FCV25MIE_19377, partial [Fagus crenata]
ERIAPRKKLVHTRSPIRTQSRGIPMAAEPSGSCSTKARMTILEERFDELINLVHLMVKKDAENDAQNNEIHLGGKNHTEPPH